MHIEFTKEQYQNLLKLVYCGDMMINGPRLYEDRILAIDNLCSHIYSRAKDFGCEDKVEFWEEKKTYVASHELDEEEEIQDFIETYNSDNEMFWDDLIIMLVDRDIKEKFKNPLMNVGNYRNMRMDVYLDEFARNGVQNLRIVNK